MPKIYKRKIGSRGYKSSYSEEVLKNAIQSVQSGRLSLRKASRNFKIPYGTLHNKVNGNHSKKVGGHIRLSEEYENKIVATITTMSNWKIPITGLEIRKLVKSYLDKQGIVDSTFRNNLPGPDWLNSFMKRHNLTQRIADNVKVKRAEISPNMISEYFENLAQTIEEIPAENIYNYDESNLTDDPGAKKVIVRRGTARVERKIQHSKPSISLMFCGNAIGEYLPPMVVYKAQNLYAGWKAGGPQGAVYDATPSGWFDSRTFENWFTKVFLANTQHKPGTKVMIGDNLPSHFSAKVIDLANQNDIKFVTLPSNTTHLCQPLYVAVFRPTKAKWREILDNWRKESRSKGAIPKTQFPSMLKRLCNTLKPQNLISGFKATGIFPLDSNEVVKRLPSMNRDRGGEEVNESFNDSLMEMLKNYCGQGNNEKQTSKRGKKIPVISGRAIVSLELPSTSAQPTTQRHDNANTALIVSENNEEWFCGLCDKAWDAEGERERENLFDLLCAPTQ